MEKNPIVSSSTNSYRGYKTLFLQMKLLRTKRNLWVSLPGTYRWLVSQCSHLEDRSMAECSVHRTQSPKLDMREIQTHCGSQPFHPPDPHCNVSEFHSTPSENY